VYTSLPTLGRRDNSGAHLPTHLREEGITVKNTLPPPTLGRRE